MATETFKKRQKEMARKEKKQKKFARKLERKSEKARTDGQVDENNPGLDQVDFQQAPAIL